MAYDSCENKGAISDYGVSSVAVVGSSVAPSNYSLRCINSPSLSQPVTIKNFANAAEFIRRNIKKFLWQLFTVISINFE